MAFLDHRELKIIKGIGTVPGDTLSAEKQPIVVNLMDPNGGIALDGTNGAWSPQIPSVKPLWAENPANDGRILVSGALNNVTETMRLIITGSDAITTYSNLRRLYDIRQDALDFWQTNSQFEPVYLKWWANCGVGPQFALIYMMDIAAEFMNSERPAIQVTLTIEREFGWRGIPPGANPKMWTDYVHGDAFNINTFDLRSNALARCPVPVSFFNRSEFNSDYTALVTTMGFKVDANLIPGDLPALTHFFILNGSDPRVKVFIAKKTVTIPAYILGAVNKSVVVNNSLNACAGILGTNASVANDTGGVKPAGGANAQRVEVSFATATNALRLRFGNTNFARVNRFIGRWMLFLRSRQNGGTAGDITFYVRYGNTVADDTMGIKLPTQSPKVLGGAGATALWGVNYLGTIDLPVQNTKASIAMGGLGSQDSTYGLTGNPGDFLDFGLFAARSAGVGVLYICDLIMIPVDEGCFALNVIADTANQTNLIVDGTGFTTHGVPEMVHGSVNTSVWGTFTELMGSEIQLTPGMDNYIYCFNQDSSNQSAVSDHIEINVNIVPRWAGIRDA